jgi:hypothetical protein
MHVPKDARVALDEVLAPPVKGRSFVGEKNDRAKAEPQLVADLSAAWEKWNKRNVAPLWHGGRTEDPTAPEPKGKP